MPLELGTDMDRVLLGRTKDIKELSVSAKIYPKMSLISGFGSSIFKIVQFTVVVLSLFPPEISALCK